MRVLTPITREMEHALEDNWDQHWADFGETSAQGPATKYRTNLILTLLGLDGSMESSTIPVHMLDIGSGMGDFASAFNARFPSARLTGLEMSAKAVALASEKIPSAHFIQRDLLATADPGDALNIRATHAVCSEVLEHLDNPETLLRNVSAYFAPGCRCVITVPGGPMTNFERRIGHRKQYTPAEVRSLLERSGFEVEDVFAAGFPFFNLYKLLLLIRGKRLMTDVSAQGRPGLYVRWGTVLFNALFRVNLMRWGWQMVAVARWPECPPER